MGVVEILQPLRTLEWTLPSSWTTSFPVPAGALMYQNADEGMDNIDESDYIGEIRNDRLIKHRLGKLTNEGLVNSITMAFNLKRFATQGHAALRLDVYLAGSKVVPTTEISVDGILEYDAREVEWLAIEFLAPWVGLTGKQWNDEIDLDEDAAQFWIETFSAVEPFPDEPLPHT